jgi:hypothetical protein
MDDADYIIDCQQGRGHLRLARATLWLRSEFCATKLIHLFYYCIGRFSLGAESRQIGMSATALTREDSG